MKFPDRASAGVALAERLLASPLPPPPAPADESMRRPAPEPSVSSDPVEPVGIVVIAIGDESWAVASALASRLGVEAARLGCAHLTLPWRPRIACGAITDDNHHFIDPEVTADHALGAREIGAQARALLAILRRQRAERPALAGRRVILVEDGLAWGYRALAAAASARAAEAASIEVATPVAARDAAARLAEADLPLVTLHTSDGPRFLASDFYADTV